MKLRKCLAGLIAATLALSTMIVTASASVDLGIVQFNDRDFVLPEGGDVKLGADKGDHPAWDAITMPGYGDDDKAISTLISQNSGVWKNIHKVTASFYIEDVSGNAFPEDIGYIQACSVMGEEANWKWYTDGINLLESLPDGFGFGPDYVMTAAWDADYLMATYGNDAPTGGVLKLILQVGNLGIDNIDLRIVWTDAQIDADMDALADVIEAAAKLADNDPVVADGADAVDVVADDSDAIAVDTVATDDSAVITEEAVAADTTSAVNADNTAVAAAGNTAVATGSSKGSANTGIEGVAVVAALAVIGTGAVIISRKRK